MLNGRFSQSAAHMKCLFYKKNPDSFASVYLYVYLPYSVNQDMPVMARFVVMTPITMDTRIKACLAQHLAVTGFVYQSYGIILIVSWCSG